MIEPIPDEMLAVRLSGTGFENLTIETVPVPEVGPDQVLCRVDASGVCSSNLKLIAQGSSHSLINGWDMTRFPLTLGEEASLTVVKLGEKLGDTYAEGQRLGIQPAVDLPPINHRERYNNNAEGMTKAAVGYTLSGMLAEYFLVPEEVLAGSCLIPLPDDDLPYFAVSIAEPIGCAHKSQEQHVHLVKDGPLAPRVPRLGLLEGGTTVVVGAGTIGRMHAELALRFRPANLIVTAKGEAARHKVQTSLAAKAKERRVALHVVDPHELSNTLGRISKAGADDIIVAVGSRAAQQEALSLLNRGGVVNLFGGLRRGDHVLELDSLDVHYRETRVVGSSGGDPWDMKDTLDLIAGGQFDAGNYVYGVGGLEHTVEILERMSRERVNGRAIVYPHIKDTGFRQVDHWDAALELELISGTGLYSRR